jgi:hypothetical protein
MKRRTPADESSHGTSGSDEEVESIDEDDVAESDHESRLGSESKGKPPNKQPRSTDARFSTPSLSEAAAIRQSSAVEDISHAVELDRSTIVSLEVRKDPCEGICVVATFSHDSTHALFPTCRFPPSCRKYPSIILVQLPVRLRRSCRSWQSS